MQLNKKYIGKLVLFCSIFAALIHAAEATPRIHVDELIEGLIKSQRKLDNFKFKSPRKFGDLMVKPKYTIPDGTLLKRFDMITEDDALRRAFRKVDNPWDRRMVVEMSESVTDILRRNGDEGVTILRNMDKEGLVFHRMFTGSGKVVEDMFRESPKAETLLRKTGKYGIEFYEKYVKPHKKKWIAAGLLAGFFSNPEKWIDASGRASEYAAAKLAEMGISVGAGLGRGLGRGVAAGVADRGWRGIIVTIIISVFLIYLVGTALGLPKGWIIVSPVAMVRKFKKKFSLKKQEGADAGSADKQQNESDIKLQPNNESTKKEKE